MSRGPPSAASRGGGQMGGPGAAGSSHFGPMPPGMHMTQRPPHHGPPPQHAYDRVRMWDSYAIPDSGIHSAMHSGVPSGVSTGCLIENMNKILKKTFWLYKVVLVS